MSQAKGPSGETRGASDAGSLCAGPANGAGSGDAWPLRSHCRNGAGVQMRGRPAATSSLFQVSVSGSARPCSFDSINSRLSASRSALLPSQCPRPAQPRQRAQSGPGSVAPPRNPPSPTAARTFSSPTLPGALIFLRVKAGVWRLGRLPVAGVAASSKQCERNNPVQTHLLCLV